jgi:hypothetical protein
MKIGITPVVRFVIDRMRKTNKQGEADFVLLRATYQAAWHHFSAEVRYWQSLQVKEQKDVIGIREAEAAVQVAQERYRQARNGLADYLLMHSARESMLVGSR